MNAFSLLSLAFTITAQYPVGGTGSYDYVRFDAPNHRLFVSHQTKVEVLDSEIGKSLGQITGLHGVHGIALAPDLNKGFITNGLNNTVTVFDPSTLKVLSTIKTGGDKPDGIEYDPATHLLIVSNGHSNSEALIDAASGQLLHLVKLSGNPESIAFDGQGHVLVNVESHNSTAQIDLQFGKLLNDWPVGPGDGPTGLALDPKTSRAFVTCGGNQKLIVLDSSTGKKIAELPIGDDSDAVVFDAGSRQILSSNRDGTLTVVQEDDADHYHVVENVKTQFGAKTLTLDPATHRVFLPVAELTKGPDEDHPGPAVPNTFKILVVSP